MSRRVLAALALLSLPALVAGDVKPKKPRLDLRATPLVAFSPVNVVLVAELRGGSEHEDFHCPELEWEWGDGGRSVREGDCEPIEDGGLIERRFTAEHAFRQAGVYTAKLTLRRASRSVAAASVTVTVKPGFADVTNSN